jgi:hypothetical protein
MAMNFKLSDVLIPVAAFATLGGLLYSLHLLRRGKKKAGYYVILITVGLFLLLGAYLTNFE